ncbi:MAG: VWA domain-containing protein, partial [bacterium]|nr:VWA domain-containing protein [bacterium]
MSGASPTDLAPNASPASARCLLLVVLILLAPVAAAQSPGEETPSVQLHFSDESSVAWVLVPVVVRGVPRQVRDLRPRAFRLWVDDRPIPIAGFEARADAPVRLIYLQDLSGSMATGGKLEASRQVLRFFLRQLQSGDEIALVTFASDLTRLVVPFTSHPARIEAALAAWRGHGTTALYDAVARLPE